MSALMSGSPLGRLQEPQAKPTAAQKEKGRVVNVILGNLQIKPWYPSFYSDSIAGESPIERLYVCQWCFRYSRELMPYLGHLKVCPLKDKPPPGDLIYRKDQYAIHVLDAEEHKLYAQNLSLFAKLFLDTKSVFYDVATFRFYNLTQVDRTTGQQQVVGFFSKEKMSWDNNNVACILVFPPWQKRGLGQLLMGVSYELGRREGRLGGPEKPLSSLGQRAYLAYWSAAICRYLLTLPPKRSASIGSITQETWILPEDVIAALKWMSVLEDEKNPDGAVVVQKAKVRAWAEANGVAAASAVDLAAFVEAIPRGSSERMVE
ncbi:SAS complex subunit [Zalaria obscura]|uniref:SAS complex subunit n=1 Tax=Zalaria obscura TaxID=2024903 RepID=A0ACC3SCJ9_9PEZI